MLVCVRDVRRKNFEYNVCLIKYYYLLLMSNFTQSVHLHMCNVNIQMMKTHPINLHTRIEKWRRRAWILVLVAGVPCAMCTGAVCILDDQERKRNQSNHPRSCERCSKRFTKIWIVWQMSWSWRSTPVRLPRHTVHTLFYSFCSKAHTRFRFTVPSE